MIGTTNVDGKSVMDTYSTSTEFYCASGVSYFPYCVYTAPKRGIVLAKHWFEIHPETNANIGGAIIAIYLTYNGNTIEQHLFDFTYNNYANWSETREELPCLYPLEQNNTFGVGVVQYSGLNCFIKFESTYNIFYY